MLPDQLLDTWFIHNRIHLYLLEGIADAGLQARMDPKSGRSVAEQFAHIHNVRLMWLDSAAPALRGNLRKFEKLDTLTHALLDVALAGSAEAVGSLLRQALASPDGRIKGFKPHPAAFLGYLVAHESHHRGQIVLTLRHSGHPLDKKTAFGLWEWGVR